MISLTCGWIHHQLVSYPGQPSQTVSQGYGGLRERAGAPGHGRTCRVGSEREVEGQSCERAQTRCSHDEVAARRYPGLFVACGRSGVPDGSLMALTCPVIPGALDWLSRRSEAG
ncbi:hypothetical protein GCM10018965_039080 [Nonomuraea roseola]